MSIPLWWVRVSAHFMLLSIQGSNHKWRILIFSPSPSFTEFCALLQTINQLINSENMVYLSIKVFCLFFFGHVEISQTVAHFSPCSWYLWKSPCWIGAHWDDGFVMFRHMVQELLSREQILSLKSWKISKLANFKKKHFVKKIK